MTVWTDEREVLLKKLWIDGFSASRIAAKLGCFDHYRDKGRSAVCGKVHRMQLSSRTADNRKKPTDWRAYQVRGPNKAPKTTAAKLVFAPLSDVPVIDDLAIPVEQRKSFHELTEDTCRWPVGDPRDPGFFFCGSTPFLDHPYCHAHCRAAYRPGHQPPDDQKAKAQVNRRAYFRRNVVGKAA